MDSDFLLIWKMKSGDENAMESFVRKYYPVIRKYCRYHVFDSSDAEDLTQDTFEHFFRALGTYRHGGKALPYLYTIAGNLCRNFYGKKRETFMDPMEAEKAAGENPVDGICQRIDMEQALARLPAELKEVVILYYFEELKQREIAEILNIGLPLVKYRIGRAKEELKKLLGEEESE